MRCRSVVVPIRPDVAVSLNLNAVCRSVDGVIRFTGAWLGPGNVIGCRT